MGPVDEAQVIDLGPAGAGIEIASGLRVGEPYAFTLQLKDASHRIRGRVRWCRLVAFRSTGERRPIYRAGIAWSPQPLAEVAARSTAGPR